MQIYICMSTSKATESKETRNIYLIEKKKKKSFACIKYNLSVNFCINA